MPHVCLISTLVPTLCWITHADATLFINGRALHHSPTLRQLGLGTPRKQYPQWLCIRGHRPALGIWRTRLHPRLHRYCLAPRRTTRDTLPLCSSTFDMPNPNLSWTRMCTGNGLIPAISPHHPATGRISCIQPYTWTTRSYRDIRRVNTSPVSCSRHVRLGHDVLDTVPSPGMRCVKYDALGVWVSGLGFRARMMRRQVQTVQVCFLAYFDSHSRLS